MTRPASKHPTELELEILKILWAEGPLTVRAVRERLAGFRKLAYTSVMTMMGIMTEKGQLARTKDSGSYVYRARIRREATLRRMLGDLVDRAFDGSAGAAALHLLDTGDLTPQELEALQTLIRRKAEEERP